MLELATPHVEKFFEDIQRPLLQELKNALQKVLDGTIGSTLQNFKDSMETTLLGPLQSGLPEVAKSAVQLQETLQRNFEDAELAVAESASALFPLISLVGESKEIQTVRLLYDRVREESLPLISQSVSTLLRAVLTQAGAAASHQVPSSIDAIQKEVFDGALGATTADMIGVVDSFVGGVGKDMIISGLSETLRVDILAIKSREMLRLELSDSMQQSVDQATRSLLPVVFDAGDESLQQLADFLVQKLEAHSAKLVRSSIRGAVRSSSIPGAKAVEDLLVAASNSLKDMLRSAVVSLGNTFNVDFTEKFDEIVDPLMLKLHNFIGQLILGSASVLISSVMQGIEDMIADAVSGVAEVISAEVHGLVDDLKQYTDRELRKALNKKGAKVFRSIVRTLKKSLKRLRSQVKKRKMVAKIWNASKTEMTDIVTKLKTVVKSSISAMKSAAGQALRDLKNALSAAAQDAVLQLLAYAASKVVAAVLAPEIILYPVDQILGESVIADALQAVSTTLLEEGSVDSVEIDANRLLSPGSELDDTLQRLESQSKMFQKMFASILPPKDLVQRIRTCIDEKEMQHEVSEILVQVTFNFAVQQFEKHLAVNKTLLQKHSSMPDLKTITSSVLAILKEGLGRCVDRVMSTELVQYSLQTAAAARSLVEEAVVVEPLLHLSFRREEVSGNGAYTTGSLEVWNKSANERLMSVKFLEVGPASRIPAGDYVASLQPWESECGTALFLEQVPDRLDARVTCGDVADAASSATILLGYMIDFRQLTRLIDSSTALADLVQLAKRHVGQLLVSIQDEVSDGPTWEQKVEEKFVRLAVGANAPIGAAPSEKTHAAQGWAFYLDVCGQKHCAYVSINGNLCAIAFGGSAAVTNWAAGRGSFSDMEAELLGSGRSGQRLSSFQAEDSRVYQVHSRVLEAYEDIKQSPNWRRWLEMFDTRCGEVHMIGHGFGGAIAMLHRLDRDFKQVFVRTFGAPRLFGAISEATCERSWRFWLQDSNCADPIPAMPSSLVHDWSMSSPLSLDKSNEQFVSTPECGQHPEILMQTSTQCRALHLAENYLHAWRKSESECDLQAGSLV